MGKYTRSNAWNNGGTFANTDLLWYAKGVSAMQALPLDNLNSWWSFAALHGEYITDTSFPGWGHLPSPPATPTTPQPPQSIQDKYWNQCQHQSWYFLPWHRGYLIALEAQIRAAVKAGGGPSDWALPYWDYFATSESSIPPAFTATTLPDGSPNPLFVKARYGPQGNGNIFVPIPPISQSVMSNDLFTGSDTKTKKPGFGGPKTGFNNQGNGLNGNLESNPHNQVHGAVGGSLPDGTYGLMSDPGIAALDPIFYLHHCNIDRMWAIWNHAGNKNPTDPAWLDGPAASGQREFVMPLPTKSSWVYTPGQMDSLSKVNYTYDTLPALAPPVNLLSQRLTRLGAVALAANVREEEPVEHAAEEELLGANEGTLPIKGASAATTVKLTPQVRSRVIASLAFPSVAAPPDRVYLYLENVRGTQDAVSLNVYVNLPEGANPLGHPELLAGTIGLFGLRRASRGDKGHAGDGLDFNLEITNIVDTLHLRNELDTDSIHVIILPQPPVPESGEVTVGRVSIYREGSK
jgi:tyrosinase